jgi:hypothetical protein
MRRPGRSRRAWRRTASSRHCVCAGTRRFSCRSILPLLDSPNASPAAVRALLRIDPENHGGISLAALAERLLTPLDRTWITTQLSAVQVLGEIGLPQLPAHVVARLRELATQDRRIVHGGSVQAFIRDDDRLRAAIRDLIDDKEQPMSAGTPC